MTASNPRILDVTAHDRNDQEHRNDQKRGRNNPGDLHMLRLALDLQLDAMLLALGAAAHAESVGEQHLDDAVPWQRWLNEDLELARTLAVALLEGAAAPVPGLGGGFANVSVETSLENLVARYVSMAHLLADVLDQPHRGQAWRPAAVEALNRCRARLEELHGYRRDVIAAAVAPVSFLPGELLG